MSDKRDYYEVLGVEKNADDKELKQAFRILARRYHPDKNDAEDAESRFKEIQEAYAVLSDPDKRRQYDRFGHNVPGGSPFGAGGFNINLEDILGGDFFSSIFGGGRRSSGGGADIRIRHQVTLEEAYNGTKSELNLDLPTECLSCQGTGAEGGSTSTCGTCRGQGRVRVRQQIGPFISDAVQTCEECQGSGFTHDADCGDCDGIGSVNQPQTIRFDIPEGADNGMVMRMRGRGEPARRGRGQPGDLHIEIMVEEHPWFERSGMDLIMSLPLGYSDLVTGCDVTIPHVDGKDLKISVPSKSNSGDTVTIPRRGMPSNRSRGRGDVIVLLKLVMPTKFSKQELKKIKEMKQILDGELSIIERMENDAKIRRHSSS